jgi:hypothetical protein
MTTLRVNPETFSEVTAPGAESTFLIVCVLDLLEEKEIIDIRIFETGQSALDFLNELDRPNATSAVVGLQLALPPSFSYGKKWQVEPVVDFTRVTAELPGEALDTYAYRIANRRYYIDGCEIPFDTLKSERSIYQASNANSSDPELSTYQAWVAKILGELINEQYNLQQNKGAARGKYR